MKPNSLFVRFNEIAAAIYFKDNLDQRKPTDFIIVCHGIPGSPSPHVPQELVSFIEKGYVLVYPHYIGTWASSGMMTWEGCVDTVLETIAFVQKGKAENQYDGTVARWNCRKIILAGGSFGGSVALVAGAKARNVSKIIAVAAVEDYRRYFKEEKEDWNELYHTLRKGWKLLWRIPSKKEFDRLKQGKADLNPIDYVDKLKSKSVFLIHGEDDIIVMPRRSLELFEELRKGSGKHKILFLKKAGHKGADIIGRKDIAKRVLSWIKH